MHRYGDYSGYINSLRNKQLYSLCCNQPNTNHSNSCDKNCEFSFENLYGESDIYNPVNITISKCITYIEPQLDVPFNKPRIYNLEANPSIPNGTSKTIVNNIDVKDNLHVEIYCVNQNGEGGFVVFNKRYKRYLFAVKGEPFKLLWNQTLEGWTVIQYYSIFK
jgi:hypothetical protein